MNRKEENSEDFCPNYVQEFGLCRSLLTAAERFLAGGFSLITSLEGSAEKYESYGMKQRKDILYIEHRAGKATCLASWRKMTQPGEFCW